MLITLLLHLRQANDARRRRGLTRGDTERRSHPDVNADRASKPRPQNEELGCGD